MSSNHPRSRRFGAALLSGVLAFAGLALTAAPASATASFDLERLAGADRFATANRIAVDTFTSGASHALIAVWDDYADALAGNYLAGSLGAPILLSQTDDVPEVTLQTLQSLGVDNVTLLGGTAVLSELVVEELQDAGYIVDREFGNNRYETAAAVAKSAPATEVGLVDGERTALLATGENFPDAVAGGPVAYAGRFPILLTPKSSLNSAASSAMTELGIKRVYILGGSAAVSDTVKSQVEDKGIVVERLAGGDRFATAVAIANFAVSEVGFSTSHVNVATGGKFPDAITGGPHAGEDLAPIVLSGNVPSATCAFLKGNEPTLTSGHIFGGTGVVSAAEENGLEQCGGAPGAADAGEYTGAGVEVVKNGLSAFVAEAVPAGASDGPDDQDRQFAYDSGDTFQLDGTGITLAQFEGLLSGHVDGGANGDVLDITYAPGDISTFNVTTDNVPAPTDATAVVDDFDNDTEQDDVIVSWSASVQGDVTYQVVRDDGVLVEPGTVVEDSTEATTITLLDEPDGTYTYSITATSTTSESSSAAATSNSVTVPAGTAASGGPQAENTVQVTAAGTAGSADANDVWQIAFDSALAPVEDGDSLTLVEGNDASQGTGEERTIVVNGAGTSEPTTAATFQLNNGSQIVNGRAYGPGQVLTIALREDAPVESFRGDNDVRYPLTVQVSTGLTNATGFPVDWATSLDRRVEADATPPVASITTAQDVDADGQISDGDTITVRFGETMDTDATEPVADRITISEGADRAELTHGANATFTYSTPPATATDPSPVTNSLLTISGISTGDTGVNYGDTAVVTYARYVTDVAGQNWDLTKGDVVVDLADTVAPEMVSSQGSTNLLSADTITITYSEAVTCTENETSRNQFTYDRSSAQGDEFKPTAIDCNRNSTVVLTFSDGVFQPSAGGDVLRYAEAGTALDEKHPDRIKDLSGNEAVSPQSVPVSG